MTVKDNHPLLHKRLAALFAGANLFEAEFASHRMLSSGRGRAEIRDLKTCSQAVLPRGVDWESFTGFPGVKQVFRLDRKVTHKKSGVTRQETVYGMTSLSATDCPARHLNAYIRGHWAIENRSHYVRDVTFGEDRSTVRAGHSHQVLAALRNACIGLMRQAGHTNIAKGLRFYAAHPTQAVKLIADKITE